MLQRCLVALAIVTTIGTAGCVRGGDALIRVLAATAEVAVLVASSSSSSPSHHSDSGSCCYSREGATPVDQPVDRPMSECELERGRWRETHQDQDDLPPSLQCLADGSYPRVAPPAAPPPAPAPAEAPEAPAAPSEAAVDTI